MYTLLYLISHIKYLSNIVTTIFFYMHFLRFGWLSFTSLRFQSEVDHAPWRQQQADAQDEQNTRFQTRSFRKFNHKIHGKNKSSISSNKKHSHLPRVWSFEFHLKCLLSNHVELWFSPFVFFCVSCSFSIPWKFPTVFIALLGFSFPRCFLVLVGSSSVVLTFTWSDQFCIGSRHTLPLVCWTKSPAWTKRAKRTGRFWQKKQQKNCWQQLHLQGGWRIINFSGIILN